MSEHTDFEELEQIPWAALAVKTGNQRTQLLAMAALALAAVAFVAWLLFRGGSTADAAVAVTEPSPLVVAETTLPATTAPPDTTPYTEADLMLIDVSDEERLAALHAEWLIRDFLTIDADPLIAQRLDRLLPDVARSETATYVEWAAPISVVSPEPGYYRVEVLFSTLSTGEEGFVRQPPSALAVELSIDVDGTARLESAPETVSTPSIIGLEP